MTGRTRSVLWLVGSALVGLAGLAGPAHGQAESTRRMGEPLTLADAMARALEYNHAIRIERLGREQVRRDVSWGNAGLLPSVTAGGNAQISVQDVRLDLADFSGGGPPRVSPVRADGAETRVYGAQMQAAYTLFDGFGGRYRYQALQTRDRAAELEMRIGIEQTLLAVADAYLTVLEREEATNVLEENAGISRDRLLRATEDRRVGTGTEFERLSAEVVARGDESALAAARVEARVAYRNLLLLLGFPPTTERALADRLVSREDLSLWALLEEAGARNTVLALASARAEHAEVGRGLARADAYPRISLTGAYATLRQEADASNVPLLQTTGFTGGISVQYGVFTGGARGREVERATLGLRIARENEAQVRREVETEVLNQFARYENQLDQRALADLNVRVAERAFDESQEAFRAGQVSSLETREAQRDLLRERLRRNELAYAAKRSELRLLLLTGGLLEG
jgi:outer membrane protein TolC